MSSCRLFLRSNYREYTLAYAACQGKIRFFLARAVGQCYDGSYLFGNAGFVEGGLMRKMGMQARKRFGHVAALLGAVVVGSGLGWAVFSSPPAYAAEPLPTLEVERLIVRHPDGRYRIEMGTMKDHGFGIFIFDTKKIGSRTGTPTPRAKMSVDLRTGAVRMMLRGAAPDNGAVSMGVSHIGWPRVAVFEKERGRIRTMLAAGSLELRTENYRDVWRAP